MEKALEFSNKDIKKLIVPLIIEQTLVIMVGMADTVMVSSIGEAAVSGVSLVDMLSVLLISIFAALATGGAVVASQMLGAKDRRGACRSAGQLLLITLAISATLMVLSIVFRTGIIRLIFGNIDSDVMESASVYLWITAISYPFLALYNSCAAIFRAMGNSSISMITTFGKNILNIIGNAICVYALHMGVAGVAVPTLVSRVLGAFVLFFLLLDRRREIHINFRDLAPDFSLIKRILFIGIPSGFENSQFQLGRLLVVSIIATFGTVQIAANAVANNLDYLGCIPGQAMSLAMITVVGRCVGARDYNQVRYYAKKLLKITYMVTFVWNSSILLTMPLLLRAYNLSGETLKLASILVLIHNGCAILFWPAAFTFPNALRAANDVKYSVVVSIASTWIFRVLFSSILGKGLGLGAIGVWIAMVMDWICRAVCFVIRYLSGKWQTKYVPAPGMEQTN